MRQELKRVEPLRAANIGALVYGLLMSAFALIFLPFFLLVSLLAPSEGAGGPALFVILMLFLYPIIGVVMGWVSGFLTSAIYNLIVRWSGGLIVEFDGSPPGSSSLSRPA